MATPVRLLAAQALLLGLSVVVLIVPASALFLERYGAANLPYVYLAVAVLGVAVSHGIRLLQSRLSLTAVAATCIGAYTGLVDAELGPAQVRSGRTGSRPCWSGVNSLAIPVGFVLIGTQVGRLLDVREVKQSFARIVAGLSLGYVVGGLGTAALIGPLGGPVDLLLVAAALGAAYLWVTVATGRRFPGELRQPPRPERPEQTHRQPTRSDRRPKPRRGGLVRLIFAYQVLVVAVTQLLDFVVWERAAYHFPDASDLARFQGLFSTLLNLLTLVFVLLAAGPLAGAVRGARRSRRQPARSRRPARRQHGGRAGGGGGRRRVLRRGMRAGGGPHRAGRRPDPRGDEHGIPGVGPTEPPAAPRRSPRRPAPPSGSASWASCCCCCGSPGSGWASSS